MCIDCGIRRAFGAMLETSVFLGVTGVCAVTTLDDDEGISTARFAALTDSPDAVSIRQLVLSYMADTQAVIREMLNTRKPSEKGGVLTQWDATTIFIVFVGATSKQNQQVVQAGLEALNEFMAAREHKLAEGSRAERRLWIEGTRFSTS